MNRLKQLIGKGRTIRMGVRRPPFAFTERGLYMLATVLKGKKATSATLAIINM